MWLKEALAQTAGAPPQAQGPGYEFIIMMALVAVFFYFLFIRPQKKRADEHKALLNALQKGDEVITQGGAVGRVLKVSDQFVTLEIAPNVSIHLQKPAVQLLLPKGTIKNLD